MVAVVVANCVRRFDKVRDIRIRVGGLPQNPKPPLNYMLVFAIEGLINEYVEPARAIRQGELVVLESLTELEELSLGPGFDKLEAFVTSGGSSTLVKTYLGKVDNLDYKTIRYPGHCEKVRALRELGFFSSRELLIGEHRVVPREVTGSLLSTALEDDDKDCVLAQVKLIGNIDGKLRGLEYRLIDYYDEKTGLTAMQRTTAFPAAIVSQMQAEGRVPARGAVPQELAVPPQAFLDELANRSIRFEETWSKV
jgi:lysine 6-dehydrogenase